MARHQVASSQIDFNRNKLLPCAPCCSLLAAVSDPRLVIQVFQGIELEILSISPYIALA